MKHRVLILDDDEPMRRLLRAWLADSATCWDAADPTAALQILLREVPDVALVDVVLPGAGGRRFVEDVQRYLPGCALIGISGIEADGSRSRSSAEMPSDNIPG